MTTEIEVKQALRDWMVSKNGNIDPTDLSDETPIIDERIMTSLHVMDLILFIEDLTGNVINVEKLTSGDLRDINSIYRNFCQRE